MKTKMPTQKSSLPPVSSLLSQKAPAPAVRRQKSSAKNLLLKDGQDPWVQKYKNQYYYCLSAGNATSILIEKADSLMHLKHPKIIYSWHPKSRSAHSKHIWAPELHKLSGKWYIYFAAAHKRSASHRMYVLESKGADPSGPYRFKGELSSPDDHWAIDGTVLSLGKKLYFIWSGWEDGHNIRQNLYIAPMSNPWTISGERVCISRPDYAWEGVINEGPEVLTHRGKVFLIYSANASFSDDYCLGLIELKGDPLNPKSWRKKPRPVFHSSRSVFGPGHAAFTTSPKGRRHWVVYHTAKYKGAGWDREIHAKPFSWNKNGTPHFGPA